MSKPTYEELEAKVKQLEADNEKAMSVLKEANDAVLLAKSKFEALAAENAVLKAAISAVNRTAEECEVNGDELKYVVEPSEFEALTDLLDETPATNAFLAEVRNEAGARAVELFAQTLGSPYAVRDEKCYEDGFTRAIEIVRGAQAPRFAAQLRKGAAQ
ncbi:hypothetical protein ACSR9E_07005 [Citrobacter koseri]|uniref:hypothetical protein n=1 Tax=Citrobacter koseri TaxID=545 RepID=UPI0040413B33